MKYLKHLKLFESFLPKNKHILNICWYNAKIGDVLPESDIYQYVQEIHDDYETSFIDGDLGSRIEKFDSYRLMMIPISDIDIDEFSLDTTKMKEYMKTYSQSNDYPPIVLNYDTKWGYTIIDGTHRANALYNLKIDKIKAWVGIKST